MPCGKTNLGETGIEVIHRKTAKETNLLIKQKHFHYLINNLAFDCDIYFTKLKEGEILERTEPQNISS